MEISPEVREGSTVYTLCSVHLNAPIKLGSKRVPGGSQQSACNLKVVCLPRPSLGRSLVLNTGSAEGAGCVQMSPAETRGPHLAPIQFIVVETFHADTESGLAMSVTVTEMKTVCRTVLPTNKYAIVVLPFHWEQKPGSESQSSSHRVDITQQQGKYLHIYRRTIITVLKKVRAYLPKLIFLVVVLEVWVFGFYL